ncbi:hypothetical protein D3C85_1116960 [compost metagenome]
MAEILGIDMSHKGKSPCIWFSGFYSQGDGACFEGSYRYKKGALKALKSEAPVRWMERETGKWHASEGNAELHRIARTLQDVQRKQFYQLEATVRHRGHYHHSGCTSIEVSHADDRYRDIGDAEDEIAQALRDFMDWVYKRLEDENDYLLSDECVDESIRANEYEFDEDGSRA